MNKKDLINVLAERTKQNKKVVKLILNETINLIKESLKKGEDVKIYGLGKFIVTRLKERKGIDFLTGKERIYGARRTVRMKVSKKIKDTVK